MVWPFFNGQNPDEANTQNMLFGAPADANAGGTTTPGAPGQNGGPDATVSPQHGPTLASSPALNIADTNPLYTAGGQFLQNQQAGSQQAQQQALQAAQNLYQGKGPSLATQLLQEQSNRTQAQNNAMASSASGSQSALARRQAMMQNSQAQAALGQQAGTARAQEQLGALSEYGKMAGQTRAQDMALAGGQEGVVQNQAGLNLQNYGVQKGVQVAQNQQTQQDVGAGLSFVGALAADAHMGGEFTSNQAAGLSLKEPGGPSHWIIREEPNFLLAANARTGELRKILTAPLSPDEHHQAMRPHGAGPIGSNNPANLYVRQGGMQHGADVDVASQAGSATGNQSGQMGANISNGAGQAGSSTSSNTPSQPNKISQGLTKAGDKLAAPGPSYNFTPDDVKTSDPGTMGDAAAKAVARGGDVSMGGSSPGNDAGQQFRQNYIDATAKSSTEAGDVTFGGPEQPTVPQTGADRMLAMMNRDPNAGYSAANLKKTAAPPGPGNRPDYSKFSWQDLSRMVEADQKAGAYPKGDVDLGSYRASLEHAADQEKFSAGGKPDYLPEYKSRDVSMESKDSGISDPKNLKNLNRGGPAEVDEEGRPMEVMPEERIAPPPKPVRKVKFLGKERDAISADTHLGGSKFRVDPPKAKNTLPRTGGGTRGLMDFYSKPKIDSVPKGGSMLGKAMMSPRKKAV